MALYTPSPCIFSWGSAARALIRGGLGCYACSDADSLGTRQRRVTACHPRSFCTHLRAVRSCTPAAINHSHRVVSHICDVSPLFCRLALSSARSLGSARARAVHGRPGNIAGARATTWQSSRALGLSSMCVDWRGLRIAPHPCPLPLTALQVCVLLHSACPCLYTRPAQGKGTFRLL